METRTEREIEAMASPNEKAISEIAEGEHPGTAIAAVAAKFEVDYQDAKRVVEKVLPTTDGPGRRSMRFCLLCNPNWNGKYGKDGTEAIAKYKILEERDDPQAFSGWLGVCGGCVRTARNGGFEPTPLPGHEDHDLFDEEEPPKVDCDHPAWHKASLVTETGGFDWVQCGGCEIYGKRIMPGDVEVVGFERK